MRKKFTRGLIEVDQRRLLEIRQSINCRDSLIYLRCFNCQLQSKKMIIQNLVKSFFVRVWGDIGLFEIYVVSNRFYSFRFVSLIC